MKKGWETKTIGDLCEFSRGLTYAKGDEVESSNNIVLRATNIDLTTNLLDFTELKYISDKVAVPDSKKVKRNSLIICTASGSKNHLGKVAFVDDDYDYAFGGFMGMLTPKNGLLPKYLFHRMTSEDYKDFIGALSDGANINNLKFDDLRKFPFPSPRWPNSSGSSACWTKRLPASPPPKPTPQRTSKTPVRSLPATSNPSSPSAAMKCRFPTSRPKSQTATTRHLPKLRPASRSSPSRIL